MRYSRRSRRRGGRPRWRWAARWRRALFSALVIGQTLVAAYYMLAVLPYHGATVVEVALLVAFAASIAWVSSGAWLALVGFLVRRAGGDRQSLLHRSDLRELVRAPLASTAVVMPIYHEPVGHCLAGIAAVYRSLAATGALEHFHFYILSDSRDPEMWLAEQAAWLRLVRELGAEGRLHYRRRRVNLRHKSGNVADFLRRWGRRHEYFVVLDADSLMEGRALVRMVRMMQLHPEVGILQAPPRIVGAHSLFARLQQFANCLYGPLFTTGLAALQLGDGAYWGHNAIIRTRAFMHHCGLRRLRGIGIFRGPILSHDFAEAACMRRGGYEVWLEPGLRGSYEASPPTLVDELARDRRWARGNLQHLALMLGRKGFGVAHRITFLNGVLAYASAPLWLAFLALSAAEVAQFTLWPIDYFPGGHRLFPVWPEWHPEWAILLASATAFVLFLPKLLAVLDAVLDRRLRRGYGGPARLAAGALLETVAATFIAPIRMLAHSRFVAEALVNLRIRWAGQNRGGEIGWFAALRMHGFGMLLGLAWSAFAWWLRPLYFFWSLPVTLPLVAAAPVSVMLSRRRAGEAVTRSGLLLTPEDRVRPGVVREFQSIPQDLGEPGSQGSLARVMSDPLWHAAARICVRARPGSAGLPEELVERALNLGPETLSAAERLALSRSEAALHRLLERARCGVETTRPIVMADARDAPID